MTTPVLECLDLCAVPGACGLDLCLAPGEFVALKEVPDRHESPLLTVAATLRRPLAGDLRLGGRPADFRRQHHLLSLRRSLGYVGPGSALVSDLTLAGNLVLGHRYHGSEEAASGRIQALVEMMLLEPLLEVKPALLPFQIRRVAVYVRELAKRPRLMVLDHPGLGLSEQAARLVCRALAEEKERGMACLLSAEQPFLALADRVIVLEEGQPATELTVHEAGAAAKVS